jgi:hypothetical protein
MKKSLIPLLLGVSSLMLLTGCLDLHLGGGTSNHSEAPTLGQQLIDLQKAKDAGIITQPEYQAQRAKLLGDK